MEQRQRLVGLAGLQCLIDLGKRLRHSAAARPRRHDHASSRAATTAAASNALRQRLTAQP